MHEYRALGRGDGSNLSEPVGMTAVMAPRGWFVSGSSLIPAMGGPLLWAWRGTERDIIPERDCWEGEACAKGSQRVCCCGFVVTTVSHD